MKEFENKAALVTGASRGVGAAAAVALAQAGVPRVLLHYGGYTEGAERTLAGVRAAGAHGEILQGDLASDTGIEQFLERLAPYSAEIDILVNNAGSLVQRARLMEVTPQLFEAVMNLNVKSVWLLMQAVAPGMMARGWGTIVNLSSIAARNGGGPGATVYSAAKAAVSAMTKGVAKELAPHGVRVNAVSPGTVDNDFHARFSTREMLDNVVRQTPQGRLSTNEEIADVIVFLCGERSRNIVGQTIEINGGMFMV